MKHLHVFPTVDAQEEQSLSRDSLLQGWLGMGASGDLVPKGKRNPGFEGAAGL